MSQDVSFIHGLVTDPFVPSAGSVRMPLTTFAKAKENLSRFVEGESLSSARELIAYFSDRIRIATPEDLAYDYIGSPHPLPFEKDKAVASFFEQKYGVSLSPKETDAVVTAIEEVRTREQDAQERAEGPDLDDTLPFDEDFPYRKRIFSLVQDELDRQAGADGYDFDGQAYLWLHDLNGSPDAHKAQPVFPSRETEDFSDYDDAPAHDHQESLQGLYAFQHASSAFRPAPEPENDPDGLRFFICHTRSPLSYEDEYKAVFHPAPHLSQDTKNVLVATDFASASVLSAASGRPVVCAMNETKLFSIARAIAKEHPDRKVHVFTNGHDLDPQSPVLPKNCRLHSPVFTIKQSVTLKYNHDCDFTYADMAEMRGLKTVERSLGVLGREKNRISPDKGRE